MNKADKKKERERKEERNKETLNIYNRCHNKVQRQFGMFINSSSTFTF